MRFRIPLVHMFYGGPTRLLNPTLRRTIGEETSNDTTVAVKKKKATSGEPGVQDNINEQG